MCVNQSPWAYGAKMTSYRRRCDVITLRVMCWDVLSKIMSPLLNLIEKSMRLGKICWTRFRDYLNNSYAGYFFSGRPNVIQRNRHENPVATHSSTHKFPPVPRQPFPVPDNHWWWYWSWQSAGLTRDDLIYRLALDTIIFDLTETTDILRKYPSNHRYKTGSAIYGI